MAIMAIYPQYDRYQALQAECTNCGNTIECYPDDLTPAKKKSDNPYVFCIVCKEDGKYITLYPKPKVS